MIYPPVGSVASKRPPMRCSSWINVLFLFVSTPVLAQQPDHAELESCFKATREALAACRADSDPARRVLCLQQTYSTQLKCLEPSPSQLATNSPGTTLGKTDAPSDKPEPSASAQQPSGPSPSSAAETGSERSQAQTQMATSSGGERNSGRVEVEPGGTTIIPTRAANGRPKTEPEATGTIAAPSISGANWKITESPGRTGRRGSLMAEIRPISPDPGGASRLIIRCRSLRTDLVVLFQGTDAAARNARPRIDYQINAMSWMDQPWGWAADRRSALYKLPAVPLLQSIPDGATLKIGLQDPRGNRREASFSLIGWNAIKAKMGAACSWDSQSRALSSIDDRLAADSVNGHPPKPLKPRTARMALRSVPRSGDTRHPP